MLEHLEGIEKLFGNFLKMKMKIKIKINLWKKLVTRKPKQKNHIFLAFLE
jgi:hypothetical protein